MTNRDELLFLRVSVARIAQVAGIETRTLRVLNQGTRELFDMASDKTRGWNDLADRIATHLKRTVAVNKSDAKILAKALRKYDDSDYASALILKLLGRG